MAQVTLSKNQLAELRSFIERVCGRFLPQASYFGEEAALYRIYKEEMGTSDALYRAFTADIRQRHARFTPTEQAGMPISLIAMLHMFWMKYGGGTKTEQDAVLAWNSCAYGLQAAMRDFARNEDAFWLATFLKSQDVQKQHGAISEAWFRSVEKQVAEARQRAAQQDALRILDAATREGMPAALLALREFLVFARPLDPSTSWRTAVQYAKAGTDLLYWYLPVVRFYADAAHPVLPGQAPAAFPLPPIPVMSSSGSTPTTSAAVAALRQCAVSDTNAALGMMRVAHTNLDRLADGDPLALCDLPGTLRAAHSAGIRSVARVHELYAAVPPQ